VGNEAKDDTLKDFSTVNGTGTGQEASVPASCNDDDDDDDDDDNDNDQFSFLCCLTVCSWTLDGSVTSRPTQRCPGSEESGTGTSFSAVTSAYLYQSRSTNVQCLYTDNPRNEELY
jgi:hypothetical protein